MTESHRPEYKKYDGYEELIVEESAPEGAAAHEVVVTAWCADYAAPPPNGLLAFRAWLDEKIASIPPAYREKAFIWDFDVERANITYSRPENANELIKRLKREKQAKQFTENLERREYERLRDKFEGDEVTRTLRDSLRDPAEAQQ